MEPLLQGVNAIITVDLFVTTAQLAQGQTWVITVKIGARRLKICPAGENSSCGKNLICNLILYIKKIAS